MFFIIKSLLLTCLAKRLAGESGAQYIVRGNDADIDFCNIKVTMERVSCPDFDELPMDQEPSRGSWLSAYNQVIKDKQAGSKTFSLADVSQKPKVDSIFAKRSVASEDIVYTPVNQSRSIICNGHDILSLSREDVMSMSRSDAHETLFQLRVEGNMMKKGFKRLRMWKMRFFILSGMNLSYWEFFAARRRYF